MELKNLKEQINKAGFSEEILASLNSVLDTAIARGSFSEGDQEKLQAIITREIEQSKTQVSIMEEIVFGLEEYAGELDLADKIANEKTKIVEEDFNDGMDDLEEQVKQVSIPNNSPEAASTA